MIPEKFRTERAIELLKILILNIESYKNSDISKNEDIFFILTDINNILNILEEEN